MLAPLLRRQQDRFHFTGSQFTSNRTKHEFVNSFSPRWETRKPTGMVGRLSAWLDYNNLHWSKRFRPKSTKLHSEKEVVPHCAPQHLLNNDMLNQKNVSIASLKKLLCWYISCMNVIILCAMRLLKEDFDIFLPGVFQIKVAGALYSFPSKPNFTWTISNTCLLVWRKLKKESCAL